MKRCCTTGKRALLGEPHNNNFTFADHLYQLFLDLIGEVFANTSILFGNHGLARQLFRRHIVCLLGNFDADLNFSLGVSDLGIDFQLLLEYFGTGLWLRCLRLSYFYNNLLVFNADLYLALGNFFCQCGLDDFKACVCIRVRLFQGIIFGFTLVNRRRLF